MSKKVFTAVVSCRIDPCSLATCHEFLTSIGLTPTSRSDIARIALDVLANHAIGQKQAREHTDPFEADAWLQAHGILPASTSNRSNARRASRYMNIREGGLKADASYDWGQTSRALEKQGELSERATADGGTLLLSDDDPHKKMINDFLAEQQRKKDEEKSRQVQEEMERVLASKPDWLVPGK